MIYKYSCHGKVKSFEFEAQGSKLKLSFYTFPFISKYSINSERMDIHTLNFSFILQTFIIYLYISIFEDESLQDERKV